MLRERQLFILQSLAGSTYPVRQGDQILPDTPCTAQYKQIPLSSSVLRPRRVQSELSHFTYHHSLVSSTVPHRDSARQWPRPRNRGKTRCAARDYHVERTERASSRRGRWSFRFRCRLLAISFSFNYLTSLKRRNKNRGGATRARQQDRL